MRTPKLYSILRFKCPFCLKGDFFVSHPYDLKHLGKQRDTCGECGRKFEKEVGFYWGAMFVSYGLSVGFIFASLGLCWMILPEADAVVWLIISSISMIAVGPYLYALSKIIWANLFFKYQGH